jgi:hypothetical protein
MGEIYSQANEVHVWLGPASSDSDAAMRYIAEPSTWTRNEQTPDRENSLYSLFDRPYWSRLWIIQELILAGSDKIKVHCGSQVVSADDICKFYQSSSTKLISGTKGLHLILTTNWARDSRDSRLIWAELAGYFPHHCSNPLDKVYGLQGLLDPKLRIAVDYDVSEDELFFRLLSNVCFNKISHVTPPRHEGGYLNFYHWKEIISLIAALLEALKPSVPLTVLMHILWAELKIRGVEIQDKDSGQWRKASSYDEYLDAFRSLWDDCPDLMKDMARGFPAVSTDPSPEWIPPPSYRSFRRLQRIRCIMFIIRVARLRDSDSERKS